MTRKCINYFVLDVQRSSLFVLGLYMSKIDWFEKEGVNVSKEGVNVWTQIQ